MAKALPKVALVWAQFAPYHIDRCNAVGERLAGRADVLAVEVATTSQDYAWNPSGAVDHATKITLFPGESFDAVRPWRRLKALWGLLRQCDMVFMGIPYSVIDVMILSCLLRFTRTRLVMLTDSKFDDIARDSLFELCKALVLSFYRAAIVAGHRQKAYLHFLRFRRRPVLLGYDVVSVDRIRAQADAGRQGPPLPMAERDFLYVGRFVPKKRLLVLIEAYGAYVARAGSAARRLVLAGSGPQEPAMRALIAQLGLTDKVVFTGFLQGAEIAQAMDRALALLLVSIEEQWGLVVNEALAVGLPVIAARQVGATDSLVANLVNGFVVQPEDQETLVQAMLRMAGDEAGWQAMAQASRDLAWRGDCARLADAVEILFAPGAEPATSRHHAFEAQIS